MSTPGDVKDIGRSTVARGLITVACASGGAALFLAFVYDSKAAARPWPILATATLNALLIAAAGAWRQRRSSLNVDTFTLFLAVSLLSGTVVPIFNATLGAPALANRPIADVHGATVAAGIGLAFTGAIIAGWLVRTNVSHQSRRHHESAVEGPKNSTIGLLIFLGLIGLVLRFPSPGALTGFIAGDYSAIIGGPQGFVGLISSMTRPLLAVGTFGAFRRLRAPARYLVLIPLLPLSLLALLSFALNRASLLFVGLALLLVALRGAGRGSTTRLALMLSLGALVFLAIGTFRTGLFVSEGGRYQVQSVQESIGDVAYKNLSVYAQSPFLVGVLHDGTTPLELGPSNLVASLASPVPKLGGEFRTESGTARYNEAIYGTTLIQDQILPISAELYAALGLSGVLVGGVLLGILVARLDRTLVRVEGELPAYALTLAGIWLAQANIASLQILSQIFWFFIAPLLILSAVLQHGGYATDDQSRPKRSRV